MVILGVTGSIMQFEPELDRSLHPGLSYITPGRQALSLSEIGDAVSRRFGGENILKWSAIAMSFSLASGLYLWWPIKRVGIRGKWGSRRLWFELHNAIGIFSLLPLALLAATGTVLGFEDQLAPVIYRLRIPEGGKCFMKRTIALLLVLALNAMAGDWTGKWSGAFRATCTC